MTNEDDHTFAMDEESYLTTNRRRVLQSAGIGVAGLTGLGLSGVAGAQEEPTVIELEAVTIEAEGEGTGRSEYVWKDGTGGEVRSPPAAICDADGQAHVWMGVSPDDIDGVANPTLELTAGETYSIQWANADGDEHNFVVVDENGDELHSSGTSSSEGDTQTLEFEATTEMAGYRCDTHPGAQAGEIVVDSTTPFELSGLDPADVTTTRGDTASFSVTVTNTSGASATRSVTLSMDGNEAASQEVTLGAGESTTVTFEMDTSEASLGSHSIVIASGDAQVSGSLAVEEADESEWIQLFNGEDLDDWTPKFSGYEPGVNYQDTFTVEDGVLRVDYSNYDSFDGVFGHLFYDNEFSHYMLRAEYRFVGEQAPNPPGDWAFRNNGLMLHGQTPEGMGIDQAFPRSLEFQLLGEEEGTEGGRANGDLCTPGTMAHDLDGELVTAHCWSATEGSVYEGDDWVTATAVVRGNERIKHILEDDGVVLEYQEPVIAPDEAAADADEQVPIDSGTISIQAESHPIEFRTIELKEIDPDEPIRSGDPTSPLWSAYRKEQLAFSLDEPQAIDVAEDGRVFFSTRPGGSDNPVTARIGMVDPETTDITTAIEIDVNNTQENGLQGIALDPDFEDNGWIYGYYSPPIDAVDTPHKKLSRFTVEGDTIDPASEEEVLRVETPVGRWYHVGGDVEFGPEGNLFLSVGDDTSPFDSSGYTPIDEREDEAPVDAQRTAANSNDLRGKILRITPTDDGGYEIPDGNMFTGPEYADERANGLVREEIYVMGLRNPFRMTVDEDGVLYWGDYGPDAGGWDPERGPPGMVEFNRAEEPGFYGWPYVHGGGIPYVDYDFATGQSGEPFDPENLVNDSPKNTGIEELPTPEEPVIWYTYSWDELLGDAPDWAQAYLPDEPPFPEFEGGAPMGGPVFEHEEGFGTDALPERFFDDRHFVGEWGQQWIRYVSYDDDGEVDDIRSFMPDEDFLSPMDMEIGPEGAFYLLEWGNGYAGNPRAEMSGIYRIDRTLALEFEGVDDGLSVDAGTTTSLDATVTNPFDDPVENGDVTLEAPAESDIEISQVEGGTIDSLVNRESQSTSWEVTAGDSAEGEYELTATASFTGADGETDQSSATTTVSVDPGDPGDPLEENLEAYFSFDGDTPTNQVTGTDATVEGDVTTGQPGVLNDAYEFTVNQETGVGIAPEDATSSGGVTSEPLPLNGDGATAATWVNFTDHEQWGRAPFQIGGSLADGPADGWNIQFQSNEESLRSELWDGGPSNGSGGTPIAVDPETWYFVVMVVEGGDARVHVFDQDGELDSSPQTWTGGSRSQSDAEPLIIGGGQGYDMEGLVDEVYAYSAALSEADVELLYSQSLQTGPVYEGLEARFTLDGDTPTNQVTGTDATIEGDVTTGQPGIVGNAYEVTVDQETGVGIPPSGATSSGGVATEPLPLNGEGATAAAWINYTDHEQWGRAPFQIGGSLADGPADGWNIQFESNEESLRPELWDGGPSNGSGGTPIAADPETWYFVVMVVDGGDARVHVFDQDGELDASPQAWTGGSRSQSDAEPLIIGGGQGYDMAGRVDDVWAYSRALSEDEVAQLYEESISGGGA